MFHRSRSKNIKDEEMKKTSFIFENLKLKDFFKEREFIEIIDGSDSKKFDLVLSFIEKEKIISIDTEHYKEADNKIKTSTIQISLLRIIYIFDIFKIRESEYKEKMMGKINDIFKSQCVLKLSYDPVQDLKILNYTNEYKGFECFNRVLDISEVKQELVEKKSDIKIKGLKGLVEHIFRKTLDKNQQTSNWKERPFKDKQIEYAALDAHVLIRIYLFFIKYNNKKSVDDLVKIIDLTFEPLCLRANVHKRDFKKSFQCSILID